MIRLETLTGEVIEVPSRTDSTIELHWFTLGMDMERCGSCGKLFEEGLHYWHDYMNIDKDKDNEN